MPPSSKPPPPAPSGTALVARGPGTALARPAGRAVAAPEPSLPVKNAVTAMLSASVAAFGDVVGALLSDLEVASQDMGDLSWLVGTRVSAVDERGYQAALQQLQWWDALLAGLPNPQLRSEMRRAEIERARALRARARVVGREAALAEHRRIVDEELARDDLDPATRTWLREIRDQPEEGEWRVDPEALVSAALAELPPLPVIPPISAEDLDAAFNFSGFNAISAMRSHPDLGPRARLMDAELAAALKRSFGLPSDEAARHAAVLTGVFWIALRRALGTGSHQLATSIQLLAQAEQAPVQAQFTRELFESWLTYLSELPMARPALGSRVPLLGRLFEKKALPAAEPPASPRLLVDGEAPKPGVWARVKGALKRGGEEDR